MYPTFSLADKLRRMFPKNHPIAVHLDVATRYLITNVAEYWYNDNYDKRDADEMVLIADVAPNVAPLGPFLWFEWVLDPDHVPAVEKKLFCGATMMVVCDQRDPNPDRHFSPGMAGTDDDTRWIIDFCYFWTDVTGRDKYLPFSVTLFIDYEGAVTQTSHTSLREVWRDAQVPAYDANEDDVVKGTGYITPALIATCFAHCKGVKVEETAPKMSRQQRRAIERGGEARTTYKMLDINPARKILAEEGDVAHNGISKALHIVRGHFAHYTIAAPLFGKHVGTYYHPMHVRGDRSKGVVVKDYNVLGVK